MNKISKTKKLLVVFLAFLIAFTYMPLGIGAGKADATSAVTGTFKDTRVLESASGGKIEYTGKDANWMQIYFVSYAGGGSFKIGPVREVSPIRAYRVNGEVAYCLEHGVMADETVKLTGSNLKSSYLESIYDRAKLKHIIDNMSLCLLYGRQSGRSLSVLMDDLGFKESSYYKKKASSYNLDDWELATRQLIHETQQRFRDKNFNKLSTNGLYYESGWYQGVENPGTGTDKKISGSHYKKPIEKCGADDIYNYMAKLIKDHINLSMKVGGDREGNAKTLKLTQGEDKKWYSEKIYVSKKEAIALKMVKNDKKESEYKNYHIKITPEGRKYYYQYVMDSEPNWDKTYTVKKQIDYFKQVPDDMLVWECKDGRGGHVQALATGSCDPIARYVKFSKDIPPEPEPEEPPSPEYFPTIQIDVDKEDLNPGFDGNTKTPMGDATLSATYVLLRNGEEVDRVTLDEYGSTGTLSDKPWSDESMLTKTASGTTSVHLVGDPPSEHCGTDGPTRYDWDAEVTYTIREIRPDGRFIEPDSGERSVTVKYNAYTRDQRNYACEKQNWSEIVYDVKASASAGITLEAQNGILSAVADPISAAADTFVNDCYRGKLTLSKSIEGSDVFSERKGGLAGGEKDSTKSLWKLKLNSGGFENHPYVRFVREADLADGTAVYRVVRDASGEDNTVTDMKIGTNGDLLVLDIPYGTYTMSEVSADDASYVLEHFQVEIGEHNKTYDVTEKNDDRYDYNVRDKKITNVIKVIKTNAETGKQVRAAGTKFYIRYMGDPLLLDPAKAKNYGRLLPNAEDITKDGPYTWEADENGEITIPYELEWGTYRLEEWLLPEGYFVGEYGAGDTAKNHDYGKVEEGQQKALLGHEYSDLVGVYDADGKKITYKGKDSYKVNEVFNFYTFTVEKQEDHNDGNFAQRVDKDGNITEADPAYDAKDYPYTSYYKAVAMANNMVKGKIEIKKDGEVLSGFKEETKDGKKVFTPIYEMGAALKDAIYNIYAAIDTWLNDGTDGPDLYDRETGKQFTIPKTRSTNLGNLFETITSALSKFFKGTGDIYETGEMLHASGAKLWYLRDRAAKEDGRYTRVYVSPEQKDTKYSYSYEKEEAGFKYRYDVTVNMNYKANGDAVTDVEVAKVTSIASGYSLTLPETKPQGSVGEQVFNPIESYLAKEDPTDTRKASSLSVSEKSYTYELLGGKDTDISGNEVDLSDIGVSAYEEKDYKAYILTAEDVKAEERVVTPAQDADGDGIFEIPEVKETKTSYEWKNGAELVKKTKGEKAVVKIGDDFAVETIGYYQAGEFVSENSMVRCEEDGTPIPAYTIPDGYSLVPFTGDPEEETHHIIASKAAEDGTKYKILLSDGTTWQDCDANGNFKKMLVQKFTARYEQVAGDENGFTFAWDGFTVDAKASAADKNVVVKITKPVSSITPAYDIGAGYTYSEDGNTVTFTGKEPTSPIFFLTKDGIKTEMYYAGGAMKTILTLPQSAVDKDYQYIVPTLNFKEGGKDNIIDWYSALRPDNPTAEGSPIPGVTWKSERIESAETGEAESYRIEIVSNQTAENPMEITFSDGYTMTMFADTAESGNGVGVIVLDNIYKTNRASLGQLVDTITTGEDGKAVSKLLPLGKYIIREVSAPNGYVKDDTGYEVELSYKDQFTPLVWAGANLENRFFTAEIDLEKVFETAFESGQYAESGGATFGLYTADEINSGKEDTAGVKGSIPANTLIDVIKVDAKGKALFTKKLPAGRYYIQEMDTLSTHYLNQTQYFFEVSEAELRSTPCEFTYAEDGVTGNVVMQGKGEATITVNTEVRYPMPRITINEESYSLDAASKQNGISITTEADKAVVKITAKSASPVTVVLPNGKTLKVSVSGNTYEWTLDGSTHSFVPTVNHTGYYAEYARAFTANTKPDFSPEVENIELNGIGTDASKVVVTATHTPETKTKTNWVDANGNGIVDEGEETLVITPVLKGEKQVYSHSFKVFVKASDSTNAIAGDVTVTAKDGKKTLAVIDTDGAFTIGASCLATLTDALGAKIAVLTDENGKVQISSAGTINGSLTASNGPKATLDGADVTKDIALIKSVTFARQDTAGKVMQVKINTVDDLNASPIKNERKPNEPDKPWTPSSESASIIITKTDSTSGFPLAGAEFELWSSKNEGTKEAPKYVPNTLIATKTSDANGKIIFSNLDIGTYFYRETKAPKGYVFSSDFKEVKTDARIAVHVTETNTRDESTFILLKVSTKGKVLEGASFEIWTAKKVNGKYVKDKLVENAVTNKDGKIQITGLKAGTYLYHETKAPKGYTADGKWHLFKISKSGTVVTEKVVNKKIGELFLETNDDNREDDKNKGDKERHEIPKTGDSQNINFWLFLAVTSASAFLVRARRKKNNDTKENN